MRLVLGSASPRRLNLLAQVGITPDRVVAPDIDETPISSESARTCALRLARGKATAIDLSPDEIALSADTVVSLGRRLLGKPRDRSEAEAFLRLLSGRRHLVTTAIAVRVGTSLRSRSVDTAVRFKRLSEAEIDLYLSGEEWQGKAGGYAIQGAAAAFVPWIGGSHSNVVGLPLTETVNLLGSAGYRRPGSQ